MIFPLLKDPLEGKEYYPWQKDIISLLQEIPDDRKIYWLWSTKGNTGKSSFCKHLVLKYGAIVVNGRPEDAYFAIIQRLSPIKKNKKIDDSDDRKVNIICFDLCRSEKNNISYVAIEGIKNGMFFSSKYKSQMCVFDPPHVIIFSNMAPEKQGLSEDRWVIKNIDQ